MDDRELVARITELADEEHRLEGGHVGRGLNVDEAQRLESLQVALDQCWDLLRQRRARREMGVDPDGAELRSERTVEGYQQ